MTAPDVLELTPSRAVGGMACLSRDQSSSSDVWLTPPHILRSLGSFDLDPCAAPAPRPWSTAEHHIALPDDGLAAPWSGRVWLNPPYGVQLGSWLKRLADHGDGIALVFARTETAAFFDHVWPSAFALLFLRGRVRFCDRFGRQASNSGGAPSCLIAYGASNAVALQSSGLDGRLVVIA